MGTVEHDEQIRDAQDARNEQVWAAWEEKARETLLDECFEERIDTLLELFKDDVQYWMEAQVIAEKPKSTRWDLFRFSCQHRVDDDIGHDIICTLEHIANHWISTEDGQRRLNEIVWELEREARG